jgi:RNA polymerase sigma-70 factor (ECF subfamily)
VDFVHRVVRRLAGPRPGVDGGDVEDMVQEVFLVALRRRGDWEGRGALRTWLYGIAVKVVAGHRRGAWFKALRHRLPAEAAELVAAVDDPTAALDSREAERLVYRALEGLGEKHRTALILYELEELSGEEIAAVMGCPVTTVWTRLYNARRKLRAEVDRLLGEPGGTPPGGTGPGPEGRHEP